MKFHAKGELFILLLPILSSGVVVSNVFLFLFFLYSSYFIYILSPGNRSAIIAFNCVDEGIHRRSHTGMIDVVNQLPR